MNGFVYIGDEAIVIFIMTILFLPIWIYIHTYPILVTFIEAKIELRYRIAYALFTFPFHFLYFLIIFDSFTEVMKVYEVL